MLGVMTVLLGCCGPPLSFMLLVMLFIGMLGARVILAAGRLLGLIGLTIRPEPLHVPTLGGGA
jgi:hypothetical protein